MDDIPGDSCWYEGAVMIEHEVNGLRYFSFSAFGENITNAVFTRIGGDSVGGPAGLNVGSNVGDEISNVSANKKKIFEALGLPEHSFFDCWQVHSSDYVVVNASHAGQGRIRELKADAMLTNDPKVSLLMRFADCTPILMYDPVKQVVGIAHAGWQGTVKRTAGNLARGFQEVYGCDPEDIIAGIGPSIGPDHYEVGEQVLDQVRVAYGEEHISLFQPFGNSGQAFNLWEANRRDLEKAGVGKIEVAGICTACDTNRWFSHRAEKGKTGRFAAVISLAKGARQ